jgi:hypothetical protein
MWTIAGGIVLGVVLLFVALILISLVVNFFRWVSDVGDDMRAKRIHAHDALLAKHGLNPVTSPLSRVPRVIGENGSTRRM